MKRSVISIWALHVRRQADPDFGVKNEGMGRSARGRRLAQSHSGETSNAGPAFETAPDMWQSL